MLRVFRIRTLLVAVALLPLAGLATFAIRDAISRQGVTQDVDLVVSDAELIGHLLVAKEAAATESDGFIALSEAAAFGIGLDFIRDNLGIDFEASITPARGRFDEAIGEIIAARDRGAVFAAPAQISALLASLDRLDELRIVLDEDGVQPVHNDEFTELVLRPLERATDAQLEAVAARAKSLGESGTVDRAATEARHAVLVADLLRAEGVALSQYLVPIRPPDNPDPDPALLDVMTTSELARHEIERLERDFSAPSLALWRQVTEDPGYQDYLDLRDRTVAGEIDPLADLSDLSYVSQSANAAVSNSELTARFTEAMNQNIIDQARLAGAAAERAMRESTILAGLVVLATLFAIALLSSAIVRPLRLLERRARRITDGDLNGDGGRTGGPREIAVVDRALSELASGLRVLERQAEALSAAELESPVLDETSPGRIGESLRKTVQRLSDMAARLDHQANYDQLTGLLNRVAGITAIEQALARSRRSRRDVAVLFIDLDGFKAVNDVHGHPVGDLVLREVARRLKQTSRPTDPVARLGGDEFIMVLDELTEVDEAITAANRIIEVIGEPVGLTNLTVSLSASVGIAWSPRGQTAAEKLLVQADLALYRAKSKGKARADVFDKHLQQVVNRRAVMETSLTRAIDDDRVELWFQPIITTATGAVWGWEALARWRRTDGVIVTPDSFIPVAERSDLILAVDRHVLHQACEQLLEWQAGPSTRGLKMAVNVSGRHLDAGDLVADVREALTDTGAPADLLVVEMTETRLVTDLGAVAESMQELRDLGIGVAIDDFGTGYSSVAHLRRIPATHLKIDRSFVSGQKNATDRSILELLAWLGAALDLDVVAEGVEDEAQLAHITRLGCTHAQGFLIGRPMPAADVDGWLRSHRPIEIPH